jgi:hypothetical protein
LDVWDCFVADQINNAPNINNPVTAACSHQSIMRTGETLSKTASRAVVCRRRTGADRGVLQGLA